MPAVRSAPRLGVLALALVALLFTMPGSTGPAQAMTKADKKMRRLINAERVERGNGRLKMADRLVWVAKGHSRQMAEDGTIYHNKSLPGGLPFKNVWWGENVGMGNSVTSLHNLFMQSDAHRANVLNQNFRRIGVGVVKDDGRTYVTVVFTS
ncbi:MAG: CAP domain-containing protein [Actinomycetota bacterium]